MGSNIQQIISTIMKWLIVRKISAANVQLQAPTTVRSVVIRVWSTGFVLGPREIVLGPQGFLDTNSRWWRCGSSTTGGPNVNGFAFWWNIGLKETCC